MRNDWLKDIKPGDSVVIMGRGMSNDTVDTVTRLTKTQVVLEKSQIRYRRDNGRQIGSVSWMPTWLREGSEEEIARIEEETLKRRIVVRLHDTAWGKKSLAELQEIVRVIEKFEKGENQKEQGG